MTGEHDYFAPAPIPGPSGAGGPLPEPVASAASGTRTRARVIGLLLLSGVLAAGLLFSLRPDVPPELRAVGSEASARLGWSPSYVDDTGRPARWDPCTPIHFVVQPDWVPVHGRRDLAAAMGRLSAVSGLTFVDDGSTTELPSQDRSAYQPERYGRRWAPLLIAWLPPDRTDLGLGRGVQGLTVTAAVASRAGGSIVSAEIALDADRALPSGFGAGVTWGEVLLHELGHAVGLGHVSDPTQVMFPQTTNAESEYGAGDRAGLAAVGRAAGCHPPPTPRRLHVHLLPADLEA